MSGDTSDTSLRFNTCLRWIIGILKEKPSSLTSEDSIKSLQEHLNSGEHDPSPAVISCVTTPLLYWSVYTSITNQGEPTENVFWPLIQCLARRGIYLVKEEDETPINDSSLRSTIPFDELSHCVLMEGLMRCHASTIAPTDKVIKETRRLFDLSSSKELPVSLEDALLLWVNKASRAAFTRHQSLCQEILQEVDPTKKREARLRLAKEGGELVEVCPKASSVSDLSDGQCIGATLIYYLQKMVRWKDFNFSHQLLDPEYALANLETISSLCSRFLTGPQLHIRPVDWLLFADELNTNVLSFLALLFNMLSKISLSETKGVCPAILTPFYDSLIRAPPRTKILKSPQAANGNKVICESQPGSHTNTPLADTRLPHSVSLPNITSSFGCSILKPGSQIIPRPLKPARLLFPGAVRNPSSTAQTNLLTSFHPLKAVGGPDKGLITASIERLGIPPAVANTNKLYIRKETSADGTHATLMNGNIKGRDTITETVEQKNGNQSVSEPDKAPTDGKNGVGLDDIENVNENGNEETVDGTIENEFKDQNRNESVGEDVNGDETELNFITARDVLPSVPEPPENESEEWEPYQDKTETVIQSACETNDNKEGNNEDIENNKENEKIRGNVDSSETLQDNNQVIKSPLKAVEGRVMLDIFPDPDPPLTTAFETSEDVLLLRAKVRHKMNQIKVKHEEKKRMEERRVEQLRMKLFNNIREGNVEEHNDFPLFLPHPDPLTSLDPMDNPTLPDPPQGLFEPVLRVKTSDTRVILATGPQGYSRPGSSRSNSSRPSSSRSNSSRPGSATCKPVIVARRSTTRVTKARSLTENERKQKRREEIRLKLEERDKERKEAAKEKKKKKRSKMVDALVDEDVPCSKPINSAVNKTVLLHSGPIRRKVNISAGQNKSNKKLIQNALCYVCLAGEANITIKQKALTALESHTSSHFYVLFRDTLGLKFKGLYILLQEDSKLAKIFGVGPKEVTEPMVKQFFKYNSGAKSFQSVMAYSFSLSTDALTIQDHYWTTAAHAATTKKKSVH